MIHQFDYLSAFVSIIIVFGVSHLLSNGARMIHWRDRLRVHYPTLLWMVMLLLLQVLIWWTAFGRRDITEWTFFGFLFYLLEPILISMLGYLLVPELKPESDLEQVYNHNRRWFFGLLAAVTVISLLDDLFLSGKVRFDLNGGMRLLLLLICIMAFGLRAKRAQLPIAVVFLVTLLSYIALVFWKL